MAEEKKKKCAHPACNCPAEKANTAASTARMPAAGWRSPATATTPNAKPSPQLQAHKNQRKLLRLTRPGSAGARIACGVVTK